MVKTRMQKTVIQTEVGKWWTTIMRDRAQAVYRDITIIESFIRASSDSTLISQGGDQSPKGFELSQIHQSSSTPSYLTMGTIIEGSVLK